MATEGGWFRDEACTASTAGGTLAQYLIVRSTGQNTAALCVGSSGGASGPRGVLQDDPTSGQGCTVRRLGFSKITASASITIGDKITCSTGGKALTATATGELVIGYANTAATAADQVIEVDLVGPFFYTAGATA